GFLGALVIFIGYLLSNHSPSYLWLANLGFVVNWFGDSLDGTVARYRKMERPQFGYFVDHTVDAFTQLLIAVGLGLSPYVSLKVALLALAGYFLVTIHTYILTYVRGVFRLSYAKLGPTEARIIAVAVNTLIFFRCVPDLSLPILDLTLLESCFLACAVVMIGMFLVSTIKHAIELAALENSK
ncbi:CDP-alcohol phosphatidyltransferase family protein, partial [bacterium]|nr:CDP-alcohol phosphatidyltransferase family protein [bacterium]